jgi:hypothetical protein
MCCRQVTPVGRVGQEADRLAGRTGQCTDSMNPPTLVAVHRAVKPFREFSERRGAPGRRVGLIRRGSYSAAPVSSAAKSASSLRNTSSVMSTALP